jgi:hypothetical protein
MKLLSKNPTFIRHRILIEEAVEKTTGITKSNGMALYREMLLAAEELDLISSPVSGERPDPHIVTVKRDEFHKRCRDLGSWLSDHAPNLKLEWN